MLMEAWELCNEGHFQMRMINTCQSAIFRLMVSEAQSAGIPLFESCRPRFMVHQQLLGVEALLVTEGVRRAPGPLRGRASCGCPAGGTPLGTGVGNNNSCVTFGNWHHLTEETNHGGVPRLSPFGYVELLRKVVTVENTYQLGQT